MSHNARIVVVLLLLPVTALADLLLLVVGGKAHLSSYFVLSRALLDWGGPRRSNAPSRCIDCGAAVDLPDERCESCAAGSA